MAINNFVIVSSLPGYSVSYIYENRLPVISVIFNVLSLNNVNHNDRPILFVYHNKRHCAICNGQDHP